MLGKVWKYVTAGDKRLLAYVGRGVEAPRPSWFVGTFLTAASKVVERWGPRWSRKRVCGHSIGTWLLAMVWLAIPLGLALPMMLRYLP